MKNILAIIPYRILPCQSGGQKATCQFYYYLSSYCNLYCVSTHDNTVLKDDKLEIIPVFSGGFKSYINLFSFFKLNKIIKAHKIDTIIIEQPFMGMFGILIKVILKRRVIVRSHNIEYERFKSLKKWWWPILMLFEKKVHQTADMSFFITENDRHQAVSKFKLNLLKTAVITYGISNKSYSIQIRKRDAIKSIKKIYNIPENNTVLMFNGVFGYKPNDLAFLLIIQKIFPYLLKKDASYSLIICGKNIPEEILNKINTDKIIVAGYVDNLEELIIGTDIFLNPIWLGGGIKTKLVDCLSLGTSSVSFKSGAIGISPTLTDGKLKIVADGDVKSFASAILQMKGHTERRTPDKFYNYFNWESIVKRAVEFL